MMWHARTGVHRTKINPRTDIGNKVCTRIKYSDAPQALREDDERSPENIQYVQNSKTDNLHNDNEIRKQMEKKKKMQEWDFQPTSTEARTASASAAR